MFTFNRKTVLALAAVTALGSFALASTEASARMGGFGHGMKMGGGFKAASIKHGGFTHGGFTHRGPNFHPRFVHRHHPHWRVGWRRHYWVAPVVTTAIATGYAAAPTWNRCTCLTKEYTPEGAVVFKDLCTKEMAMNPPLSPPSATLLTPGPASFDPNQTSSLQGSVVGIPQASAQPMPAQAR
jgi:hypothetical protein